MKKVTMSIAALAMAMAMAVPLASADEMTCTIAPMPDVPATFSSADDKAAVKEAVLGFIGASANYRECLEAKERSIGDEITPEQETEIVEAINANVDDQEVVATRYNAAAKAFAESNP